MKPTVTELPNVFNVLTDTLSTQLTTLVPYAILLTVFSVVQPTCVMPVTLSQEQWLITTEVLVSFATTQTASTAHLLTSAPTALITSYQSTVFVISVELKTVHHATTKQAT